MEFTQAKHNQTKGSWQRKKAKRMHTDTKQDAIQNLRKHWRKDRDERKWSMRQQNKTIVADSAATSTVIRVEDMDNVEVPEEDSNKVYRNANGTILEAGKTAKLPFRMRHPATDADIVPGLVMNSLLSTSKCADAGYITIFTPDKVKIFDAKTTRIQVEGEAVL